MILYWIQALILYLRTLGAPCAAIYTNSVLSLSHICSICSALVPWCTGAMWWNEFPRQVSILWPSAYKAITIFKFGHLHVLLKEDGVWDALPLSYRGLHWVALVPWCTGAMWCVIRELGLEPRTSELWAPRAPAAPSPFNTDNPFRSSDLVVMSHARCLCAMPVYENLQRPS